MGRKEGRLHPHTSGLMWVAVHHRGLVTNAMNDCLQVPKVSIAAIGFNSCPISQYQLPSSLALWLTCIERWRFPWFLRPTYFLICTKSVYSIVQPYIMAYPLSRKRWNPAVYAISILCVLNLARTGESLFHRLRLTRLRLNCAQRSMWQGICDLRYRPFRAC